MEHKKQGFTLVEIALALMVVSVGLLAVFALFPAGLTSNKLAVDDTASALFAQEVFNGLRAEINRDGFEWGKVTEISLDVRSSHMWKFEDQQVVTAGQGRWEWVYYIPDFVDSGDMIDKALRYNLIVQIDPVRPDIAACVLEVVAGEYGPDDNPVIFYTEFMNPI